MVRRRAAALVNAIVLLSAAAACGDREDIEMVGDDPRVFVQREDLRAYPDMGYAGTLEYSSADRCLYFRTGSGRIALVWPPGTEPVLENGTRGVDVPGAGVILEGASVLTGGVQLTYGDEDDPWGTQVNDLEVVTECLPQGASVIVMVDVEAT